MDAAIANYGRLDILVNNSGVYAFAPLEQVTEADFHRMFNVNVLGAVLLTQAAIKHLGAGATLAPSPRSPTAACVGARLRIFRGCLKRYCAACSGHLGMPNRPDNTDLSDAAWALVVPLLPPALPGGRPRTTDIRAVVNAIFYLLRTGCQ